MPSSKPVPLLQAFRIVFLLALLLSTGCNILYVPNAVHVPLFTKENTLQAKAALGNAVDVSAAYSITENIAVMALGSFAMRTNPEGQANSHVHTYGEIAGGRYWHKGMWRAEIYAGAGYGVAEARWNSSVFYTSDKYSTQAEYMRLFSQINMGVEGDLLGAGIVSAAPHVY